MIKPELKKNVFISLKYLNECEPDLRFSILNGFCGRLTVAGITQETGNIVIENFEGKRLTLCPNHLWISKYPNI